VLSKETRTYDDYKKNSYSLEHVFINFILPFYLDFMQKKNAIRIMQ